MTTMEKPVLRGPKPGYSNKPISRLIVLSGLCDEGFGELAGAAVRTVAAWRRGEKQPTFDRLLELVQKVATTTGKNITLDSLVISEDKKICLDSTPLVL